MEEGEIGVGGCDVQDIGLGCIGRLYNGLEQFEI